MLVCAFVCAVCTRDRGCSAHPAPPRPLFVQTGDKVDGCSETSWTLSTANQGGCRMPFHEGSRMDARMEFVMLASVEGANVRSLCRRFGVSPTTGYKWLERWRIEGMAGLEELSRRPQGSPRRSAAATEDLVLSLRTQHPAWGGRKIARRLKDLGYEAVPAPS